MAADAMTSLWPTTVRLAEAARGPVLRSLVADEPTRRRIARALALADLGRLEAEVTVSPWLDGVVIEGRWRASLVQTCVVTLEPLPVDLQGEFTVRAVPEGSSAAPQDGAEVTLEMHEADPPDVLDKDEVDVGHYVVEQLSLELDPFPRKPGALFDPPAVEEPESPFAILRRLKDSDPEG